MSIERTIYTNVRYVRMCVQRMFVLLSGCLSNCLCKAIHETSNEPSLIMLMFDWPHTLESFGNIYYMPQLQNAFNIIEINMAQSSNISNVGMWATYLQFTFDVESKPCVFFCQCLHQRSNHGKGIAHPIRNTIFNCEYLAHSQVSMLVYTRIYLLYWYWRASEIFCQKLCQTMSSAEFMTQQCCINLFTVCTFVPCILHMHATLMSSGGAPANYPDCQTHISLAHRPVIISVCRCRNERWRIYSACRQSVVCASRSRLLINIINIGRSCVRLAVFHC